VEDNSGRGKGPPRTVVPEEEEEERKKERKKYELSNLLYW
jgi:hypothetical protein